MKWSWKIGSFKGIGVFMHASFLLIIAWVGFANWAQTRSLAGTMEGIFFTLVLFGTVVLHEFGHALTAKRYGIKTRDITLYPIGGVARLERMPDKPVQEFWVALAGPAVNIVIAAVLFAWLMLTGSFTSLAALTAGDGSFIERLLVVNVFLVLFNLIPAFPMDGGRVLRSLLAMRLEYAQATSIAASIGRGMAVLFGIYGLFTNPFLVVIAVFVWIGAGQEPSMVQMKSKLEGIPVQRAMLTDFHTLSVNDTLAFATQLILASSQADFPVVDNDKIVGIVRRNDLLTGLASHRVNEPVSTIMERDVRSVEFGELLETAITRLQGSSSTTMPVMLRGKLVGLLNSENIGEFLMIQSALRHASGRNGLIENQA